jgi:hypothetical protein
MGYRGAEIPVTPDQPDVLDGGGGGEPGRPAPLPAPPKGAFIEIAFCEDIMIE